MTNIEANYAQIEKLLSIVIAMDKFHHYTFARHVIVQSGPTATNWVRYSASILYSSVEYVLNWENS